MPTERDALKRAIQKSGGDWSHVTWSFPGTFSNGIKIDFLTMPMGIKAAP